MRDGAPSFTAEVVCFMRAAEQRKPPALRVLDDPYAPMFLGPLLGLLYRLGLPLPADNLFGLSAFVLARHRFIDDHLVRAIERGVDQLVVLGAGYDSRAHRFAELLGDRVAVFEVDHPATARRKRELVRALSLPLPPRLQHVSVDFQHERADGPLLAAGFDAERPAFIVWEGVTMYLTHAAVSATLTTLAGLAAPGAELALDLWYYDDKSGARSTLNRVGAALMPLIGEPVTFSLHPRAAPPFFGEHGFVCEELADAATLSARFFGGERRVMDTGYLVHARRDAKGRMRPA